jgi:hypothetical protein
MLGCPADENWKVLEIDNPDNWLGCSTYSTCLPYSLAQSSVVWRSADWSPLLDTEIQSWGTSVIDTAKENIFAILSVNLDVLVLIIIAIWVIYLAFKFIRKAIASR